MRRVVLLILLAFLVACSAPVTRLPTATGDRPSTSPPLPGETPQPALLERRIILLEWSPRIREKDSDRIDLTIALDPAAIPTATPQDGLNPGEQFPVDIPNIYETHNLVAVARLDIAGMEAIREEIRETMQPGREVTFRWSVRANDPGVYRGVVWLHLEMVPKTGGPVERVLLVASPIDIEAYTVFGLSGGLARTLGVLGVILSTALGYPIIQRILDAIFKKKGTPPSATKPPANHRTSSE